MTEHTLPPEVEEAIRAFEELAENEGAYDSYAHHVATLRSQAEEIERLRRAVGMSQTYINSILGCPSPDFLASASLEVEEES